jgi:hypothetical protein
MFCYLTNKYFVSTGMGLVLIIFSLMILFSSYYNSYLICFRFVLPPQRGSRLIARPPGGPEVVAPVYRRFNGGMGGRPVGLNRTVPRDPGPVSDSGPPHFHKSQISNPKKWPGRIPVKKWSPDQKTLPDQEMGF